MLGSDPVERCYLRFELEAPAKGRSHPDGAVRSFDLLWTFLRSFLFGLDLRSCAGKSPARVDPAGWRGWVG
jgi:hypothetical protein